MHSTDGLSKRVSAIAESATLKLNSEVKARIAAGDDIINFTAGEPDFFVPESVKKAAIRAIEENKSRYTPVPGIDPLREGIAQETSKKQGTEWTKKNVVVSVGAKHSLANVFLSLLDEGDEVLIPAPYWLSYPEMVNLSGGMPRTIETSMDNGFKVTPKELKEALERHPKVKCLIFNSPSNPTGAVYSKKEFEALGSVLKGHSKKIWVISDEIYDKMVYPPNEPCSFLAAVPDWKESTITVNGLSKCAAMTGWRVGWMVGPEVVAGAVSRLQGQMTSGINAPAQWAALEALALPQTYFEKNAKEFAQRRDRMLEILAGLGKIKSVTPAGAFYVFLDVRNVLNGDESTLEFASRVLDQAQVAVVPGDPFGAAGFVRLSFALDMQSLEKGCERIVAALN